MREKDHTLSAQCEAAAGVAKEFIAWSTKHPETVGPELGAIKREFNKYATKLSRLSVAAKRPMTVAVFGPSQAGKSYLISALAREGNNPLRAKIGNESVDFLEEINPIGGKESTGIVTRFSIRENNLPFPNAPVKTRLLSQLDIIKILGNTYLSDTDPASIDPLPSEYISELLSKAEKSVCSENFDGLTAEDVFDLRDYFVKNFRGVERIRSLDELFWEALSVLLPKLPPAERANLLTVLWGEAEAFSNLYLRLYGAMEQLGFSGESYSALGSDSAPGALLPRNSSVIDVATLAGLGEPSADQLEVTTPKGTTSRVQRNEYTALISELVIQIEDIPYDYFNFTDLLDFPGYRSREQIRDLENFLAQDNGIESLFLRGKVAYLFQRYREERELTSMLLCIGDSNQEVKALPDAVDGWIGETHGESPLQRENLPVSLFFVLTKFDKEFDRKGGGGDSAEDYAAKWSTRLHSSLWDFFGKQHRWPFEWNTKGAFNNTFWIRNPNYEAPNLYQYDDLGREIGLLTGTRDVERMEGLKQAFLSTEEVSRHFKDPQKSWDAALATNDGGITYLASELGKVCDPDLKYSQLHAQFSALRDELQARIGEFHVGDDAAVLIEKRIENSKQVVRALVKTSKAERFGSLISQFSMAEGQLKELYTRLDQDFSSETIVVSETAASEDDILSLLGLEEAETSSTSSENADTNQVKSLPERYAQEVSSMWMSSLQSFVEDSHTLKYHLLTEEIAHNFVKELKAGFIRLRIENRISRVFANSTRLRMDTRKALAQPTRLGANLVNDYVNFLGFRETPEESLPKVGGRPIFKARPFNCGLPELTEAPSGYQNEYVSDWLMGFLSLAEQNARADGGVSVDPQANQKLTNLLAELEG
ncbi:MAG: hypothetical protein HWE20_10960 [Gammaproteobacteria bacterium]|nr:hypothetical protein [Gammaproteobacteria bacterium]